MHDGYRWWTTAYAYKGRTLRAYFASGNGGQVVGGWAMVREYIPGYILPALRDSTR